MQTRVSVMRWLRNRHQPGGSPPLAVFIDERVFERQSFMRMGHVVTWRMTTFVAILISSVIGGGVSKHVA